MLNLIAWIQNPDKTQKDLILNNGAFVVTDEHSTRDEISKKIFDIDSNGKHFYKSNAINIIRFNSTYLIKLQTSKLDENGRSMPMMMLVENYQENSNSELKNLIDITLSNSKYELDNNFVDEILNQLKIDLENLIKKKKMLTIGVGILFLTGLILLIKSLLK